MSPENYGVFQVLKEVNFQRILAFYNSQKWGHFGGVCSRRSGWLVGLVRDISASLRNNKGLGVAYFLVKAKGGGKCPVCTAHPNCPCGGNNRCRRLSSP